MNRRKFIENAGRTLSATLLGLLAGYLVLNKKIGAPAACTENAFCRNCRKFSACEKPQALKVRSKKRNDGKE